MTTAPLSLDANQLRSWFPSLAGGLIYMENAGGSQVPRCVPEAISDYMTTTYVQLGAPYELSERATKVVDEAHSWTNRIMGGEGAGMVVLGSSSTQLVSMLAECYSKTLAAGDEIVVSEVGHEANIGAWVKLQRLGVVIKFWSPINRRGECDLAHLEDLLSPRTRLVCVPHVSNLLGAVVDVAAVAEMAHRVGARVVIDGVAYAPHRPMDVAAWGVDWYFYSTYKVYGPHMGALFGRFEAFAELEGPNHFFIPNDCSYKFELGGSSHEGCAGLLGLAPYLRYLAQGSAGCTRAEVVEAFSRMGHAELPLQERLLEFLAGRDVEIIGPVEAGIHRVPTISFIHPQLPPEAIVSKVVESNIGIRSGHMYAYRLCQRLGIDVEQGVVRVSLVHYNTMEEVERLITALTAIL